MLGLSLAMTLGNPTLNAGVGVSALAVLTAIEWNQADYPLEPAKVGGVWTSGFDPDDYLPLSYFVGTPLFVDFTTGSDAANGQSGTPVKSLWRAINLVNAAGVPTHVTVNPGTFPRANWFNSGSTVLTTPAWFEVVGGRAVAYNGDVLTWPGSPDATYPNTYKASRSSVARVVNLLGTSPYGTHYADFAKVADAATCNSTANSWAQVGSDLYVNRGGGTLNANTRAYLTTNGLRTSTSVRLTGFDIEGGGGSGGCFSILNAASSVVIAESCTFRYSGSDAIPRDCCLIEGTSTGLFAFLDCDFSGSSKDGLNHTRADDGFRLVHVLTERCSGDDFGRGASTSNNAITGHFMTVQADFDNQGYSYGRAGLVRFVNDSRLAMFGGSASFDLNDGSGFTPSVIRADNTAEIRLVDVDVTSAGEATLLTADDAIIWTNNVTQTGGTASGDIRPF